MDSANNGDFSPRKARGRPRGWGDQSPQNTIKSLDRALEILEHLSAHTGQALTSIAADLDESPATVYRALVTLENRGIVEFDHAEQLWHIGAKAFVIGAGYLRRTSLVDRARPILRRLMEATGETANLGTRQDGSVLFVSQVETHSNIRAFFPPGTLSPLHASGIGKALLAELPEDRLPGVLKYPLVTFTPKTHATPETLLADLRAIRARGYALDDEEKNLGMRCIAAPVFDIYGEAVAGISVSGPATRISLENMATFAGPVIAAAVELTTAMGGTGRQSA